LRKEYGELPPVRCLPNRIGQVFVNLLVNAGQAIDKQGEIALRTRHAGGEVRIEVADTGCGIAPEHLGQIFQPFFTTKPNGIGTGLGLAVSADIVAQHGGCFDVQSEPGRGTTFILALPVDSLASEARD
jgi:two-component system, NtrC family, sensor kinase